MKTESYTISAILSAFLPKMGIIFSSILAVKRSLKPPRPSDENGDARRTLVVVQNGGVGVQNCGVGVQNGGVGVQNGRVGVRNGRVVEQSC